MPIGFSKLPPAKSIADVIAGMQAIDAALNDSDGVKWFNYLYLAVTEAVDVRVSAAGGFSDPAWITRLDVAFANLYFDAVRAADAGGPDSAPPAWRPLLKNRNKARVARIQFALAGMNAHINRDLVFTLLGLYRQDGAAADKASARYADFTAVNALLETVESQVKPTLLVGTPLEHGGHLAPLEDLIAMWGVRQARESAWNHSQAAWHLRTMPQIQRASLESLDGATQFASSALLVPVLP